MLASAQHIKVAKLVDSRFARILTCPTGDLMALYSVGQHKVS